MSDATRHLYMIAIGSNRAAPGRQRPEAIVAQVPAALEREGFEIVAQSDTLATSPVGPARRRFANAAVLVGTPLAPPEALARLKRLEQAFGRRPGRRWGDRPLDLDIILWSGGTWLDRSLRIPHAEWTGRTFVVGPLLQLSPHWPDAGIRRLIRAAASRLRASKR